MITTTNEEADEQVESTSRSEDENAVSDEEEKTPVFNDNGKGIKTLQQDGQVTPVSRRPKVKKSYKDLKPELHEIKKLVKSIKMRHHWDKLKQLILAKVDE